MLGCPLGKGKTQWGVGNWGTMGIGERWLPNTNSNNTYVIKPIGAFSPNGAQYLEYGSISLLKKERIVNNVISD